MKRVFLILPVALLAFATSCGGDAEVAENEVAVVAENVESKDYTISTTESLVEWSAEGATHGHNGTIGVQSGSFTMKEDKIEAGTIEIDMTSLVITDIEDSTDNAKLYGHLTTEDFLMLLHFQQLN